MTVQLENKTMALPARLELATPGLGILCSILTELRERKDCKKN